VKVVTVFSWLNFSRPAPPREGGLRRGESFGSASALLQPARSECVSLSALFHFSMSLPDSDKVSARWRCEISQWSAGMRIVRTDQLTATVRQHSTPSQHMTVVCCGPADLRKQLFFFQVRLPISRLGWSADSTRWIMLDPSFGRILLIWFQS